MSRSYDVIVVGVGAMGASTCYHLARRGVKVLGIERFDVPHEQGSSGGQSRLTRLAYYEHPDYVPLLRRAWDNWESLGEMAGVRVIHRTGMLYIGAPEQELITGVRRAAVEHDLPLESLDQTQLNERCGPFVLPDGMEATWEPQGGFVLSQRSIAAASELALRAGGAIQGRERVLDWSSDSAGVRVITDRDTYHAQQLVLTAGPWTASLLKEFGVELRVTRQVIAWVWPDDPDAYSIGRFSCWAIQDDSPGFRGIYYGFPLLPVDRFEGECGLKLAHHVAAEPADPETVRRKVTVGEEESFRPALRKFLPGAANAATLSLKVCLYTNTPDEHFIIDRHPGHERVIVACGFSGHGFKFASAIGEALADLSTEGRTDLPIGFLGLSRFA